MKRLLTLGAAAVMALSSVALLAPSAEATNPSPGYSFDGTPHVIVDGGSDTTYKAMNGITNAWNTSAGCEVTFPLSGTSSQTNKCLASATPVAPYANWQHDTVVQANPAGSGNGIASLNGFDAGGGVGYAGSLNTLPAYLGSSVSGPQLDMARSSRGPKTSGGNAIGGNESAVDAFWGFAQDGVQLLTFQTRTAAVNTVAIPDTEIGHIFDCTYTQWSQVPSLAGLIPGTMPDGPIVVWGMNSGSGTYSTFKTWLQTSGGLGGSFDPDSAACARKLSNNTFPLENDIKPLLTDAQNNGGLSTAANSTNNPTNWVWWGSFGLMSAYPYLSSGINVTGAPANPYGAAATNIHGVLPSTANILSLTYPISRTLYHVTRKQDADCPTNGAGACASLATGAPPGDINVTSTASGGNLGAVREFTRFMCRQSAAQQTVDPFTGTNEDSLITAAISGSGFTVIKAASRTAGSRCNIASTGS